MQRMASSEIAVESLPATERLLHRKMVRQTNVFVSQAGESAIFHTLKVVMRRLRAGGAVEHSASLCQVHPGGKVPLPTLTCIYQDVHSHFHPPKVQQMLSIALRNVPMHSSEAGDSSSTAEVEAVEKEAADLDARVQTLQQKVSSRFLLVIATIACELTCSLVG